MIPLGVCRFEVLAPGPAKHMRVLYIVSWVKAVKHKKRSGTFDDDFTDKDFKHCSWWQWNQRTSTWFNLGHGHGESSASGGSQHPSQISSKKRSCGENLFDAIYVLGLFWWLLHHYICRYIYMSNCIYLQWWRQDVPSSRVCGNVGFACKTRSKRDGGTPKTR